MSKRTRSLLPTATGEDSTTQAPDAKRAKTNPDPPIWATKATPEANTSAEQAQAQATDISPTSPNAPASAPPPLAQAPKLETRFDLSLYNFVEPPSGEVKHWQCKLGTSRTCNAEFNMDSWCQHAMREHQAEVRLQRQTVSTIWGFVPSVQEMFGAKKGWRKELVGSGARFRSTGKELEQEEASLSMSERLSRLRDEEDELEETRDRLEQQRRDLERQRNSRLRGTSRSPSRQRHVTRTGDVWIRARDGSPRPRVDWVSRRNGDSWNARFDDEPATPAYYRDEPDTPMSDGLDSPEAYMPSSPPCDCEECQASREQTQAAPPTPLPPRFEQYGAFNFTSLPAELRNEVYKIAVADFLDANIDDPISWRRFLLTQASPAIRAESLAIYAHSTHFRVPYRKLNEWMDLVGDGFLRHLKKLDISFPNTVENARMYDFTAVYRLKCYICPRLDLTFSRWDGSTTRGTSIEPHPSRHWSQTDKHDVKFGELVAKAKAEKLSALFFGDILTEVFLNVRGELVSVKATNILWLTYEHLKEAFDPPKDFRLSVDELPWHGSLLASTMAPRTTRASKTANHNEVDSQTTVGGSFGASSLGGSSFCAGPAGSFGSSTSGGFASMSSSGGGWGSSKGGANMVKPQQPSWFSSSATLMRGTATEQDEDDDSD